MLQVLKIYFEDQRNEKQIRRLTVSSDIYSKFDLLSWKIRDIFPSLVDKQFEVTWKDSENDMIHMSSDEELAEALANAEEGLLRIYVRASDHQQCEHEETAKNKSSHNEIHPNVVCDICDKNIYGYRYKCLQCRNYDLCSDCNATNKHGDHDMIKLVRPTHIQREWVFLGARKLWRSMFGRCPFGYFQAGQKQKEDYHQKSPQEEKSTDAKYQWHNILDDLLRGDPTQAEKFIKENFLSFMNFNDHKDVKPESPLFSCSFGAYPNNNAGNPFSKFCQEKSTKTKESTSRKSSKEDISASHQNDSGTANKETVTENVTPKSSSFSCPFGTYSDKNEESKEDISISQRNDSSTANRKTEEIATNKNDSTVSEEKRCNNETTNATNLDASAVLSGIVGDQKVKESSPTPCGLFCETEKSINADGWTLVNGLDPEKKDYSFADVLGNNGAKPKNPAFHPDITETLKYGEISEHTNTMMTSEESTYCDPEILNALAKMQAMGFTNEGGWLSKLLITKDGNINAALDALYPNARRN